MFEMESCLTPAKAAEIIWICSCNSSLRTPFLSSLRGYRWNPQTYASSNHLRSTCTCKCQNPFKSPNQALRQKTVLRYAEQLVPHNDGYRLQLWFLNVQKGSSTFGVWEVRFSVYLELPLPCAWCAHRPLYTTSKYLSLKPSAYLIVFKHLVCFWAGRPWPKYSRSSTARCRCRCQKLSSCCLGAMPRPGLAAKCSDCQHALPHRVQWLTEFSQHLAAQLPVHGKANGQQHHSREP